MLVNIKQVQSKLQPKLEDEQKGKKVDDGKNHYILKTVCMKSDIFIEINAFVKNYKLVNKKIQKI